METMYPNLREALDPVYSTLTDAEIESLFESAFGEGVTPAEYEEFFGSLGSALKKAAPGIGNIAQGAFQGATAGSALGPWGALGGALVGGTGAGLRQYGGGTARQVGGVLGSVTGAAGQLTGRGALPGAAGGLVGAGTQALAGGRPGIGQLVGLGSQVLGQRSPAAGQLLGLLGRPQMLQALGSLASGRNPAIPLGAGRPPVPANAFAGLLGALGRAAEAESLAFESAENVPAYLVDSEGHFVVDPREPDLRAARVLQLLNESDEAEAWDEWEGEADDEAFDEYGDSIEWWAA